MIKMELKSDKNNSFKEKILIFEPHPDDVAFLISGSVFKWLSQGKEVMICTITTGNNSTFDINVSSDEIKTIMDTEHTKAMKILNLDENHLIQWNYNDLGLDPYRDRNKLLMDMISLIRTYKPATVITMDTKHILNEENPDHRLVSMTGFEAAAMAAYPNVFREQLNNPEVYQHFVSRVLFYNTSDPDLFIDISGEFIEKKIKLGLIYDSQLNLMQTEGIERLKTISVNFPLFNIPKEKIWPEVCKQIARANAKKCKEIYPDRDIEYAEIFRIKYLGVLNQLRGFIPESVQLK
jgi:LmbE family N-acetylglucosaminyl deacetylase